MSDLAINLSSAFLTRGPEYEKDENRNIGNQRTSGRTFELRFEGSSNSMTTLKSKAFTLVRTEDLDVKKSDQDECFTPDFLLNADSPILAEIPNRIFAEAFAKKGLSSFPILEFRRKKVIRAEDHKFLKLIQAHNYAEAFPKEVENIFPAITSLKVKEESRSIKKIRKSAILRKVINFWEHKSGFYPTVFKKVGDNDPESDYLYEIHDLTKVQFTEAEHHQRVFSFN
jgi:hypothetical protein